MRPWRATPSHWGRRKGRRIRADPGARTKPGDVSLCLPGCLTSEYVSCREHRADWCEGECSNGLPPPLRGRDGVGGRAVVALSCLIARPPSLSLPRKGGGNDVARAFAT